MSAKLTVDKGGRIVLPKTLRDELRLCPGDTLSVDLEGDRITLKPLRAQAALRKKSGIWIHHSDEPWAESIPDVIDREREKRIRELSE